MIASFNPYFLDKQINIAVGIGNAKTGVTYSGLHTSVYAKKLEPLRVYESERSSVHLEQPVHSAKNSWLIRREDKEIIPKLHAVLYDGAAYFISNVRDYKGSRDMLVLDTEIEDSQSFHLSPPTNLALSNETTTGFDASVTSGTAGIETGFSWEVSTDNFVSDIQVNGTTAFGVVSYTYTSLSSGITYYARVRATGYDNSDYTSTVSTITL